MTGSRPSAFGGRSLLVLGGFLALSALVSAGGGAVTATSVGTWYPTLVKPAFNPPDWIFPPVWTTLFVLMAVAAWRIWLRAAPKDRVAAFTLYGLQLALNLLWSLVFFGARAPGWAFLEVIAFFLTVLATTVAFWRIDRWAGLMFMPYVAWVGYATLLNASIWLLN